MNEITSTPASRQLALSATTPTALSRSPEEFRGGQGAHGAPTPPQFNLPDSYWAQPRGNRTRDFLPTPDLLARYMAAIDKSNGSIATMLEKLDADRENDPRSRTECRAFPVNRTFQPGLFRLSAETLAGLIVLKDPESDALESSPPAPSATGSAATVTQQDASGCCIPPSCAIL